MTSDAERLHEQDSATHKARTWLYWAITAPLTSAMVIAYPPTRALGAGAGWSIAGVLTVVTALYIVRLYRTCGEQSDAEIAAGAVVGVLMTAVVQWLCGGYHAPIAMLYASQVFGASAVLTDRMRGAHLGLVAAAVLAPAVYGPVSAPQLVSAGVWVIVLTLEAGFLYEYALRLRAHRVALMQAERHAAERALTDELTGLGNRRALEADVGLAQLRAEAGQPVTVGYLDLDGFKSYNDEHGHAAGDELLRALGAILLHRVDGLGRAYRIGGDEFCVLLAGGFGRDADQLRAISAGLTAQARGFAITPSCGWVVVPDEAADVRAALQLADQRMYAAKRGLALDAA